MDICRRADKGPIDTLSGFMFWLQYPDTSRGIVHFDKEKPVRTDRSVNRIMSTILSYYQYLAGNNMLEELDMYKAQRTSGMFKSFLSELTLHRKEMMKSIFYRKVPDKKVEALTREKYNILLASCKLIRDRLLLALLFECGLRIGEAVGMHLEDATALEEGRLDIVPRENNENGARVKNYAEGSVFPPDYVVDLLIKYLTDERPESSSSFLFLTSEGTSRGLPMMMSSAKRLFERLSVRTGIVVHAHMLRHGFAQEKLDAGWTLEQVQAYLRHKNVTSTQIYAQYTNGVKREKMRTFLEEKKETMTAYSTTLLKGAENERTGYCGRAVNQKQND